MVDSSVFGSLIPVTATTPASTATTSTQSIVSTNPNDFDDNVLGNYNNPTYHLCFYAKAEQFATLANPAPTSVNTAATASQITATKIIIAETGVTGYNIHDFILKSIIAPGVAVRNTMSVSYTMTINEPNGTSFLDAMYSATTNIGIKNWQKSDYYMDISFKGYNEDGALNTNLCSNFPNGGVWTYKLRITNIHAELSTQGSSYTIQGNITDEDGWRPEIGALSSNINVAADNLSEFLTNFQNALNTNAKAKYALQTTNASVGGSANQNVSQLYTYAFQCIGFDPTTFIFSTQDDGQQSHRNKGFTTDIRSKFNANLATGSMINDMIQAAIGSTIQGQNFMIDSTGADNGDLGSGGQRAAGLFRIYPVIQNVGYDTTTDSSGVGGNTNSYIQTITYYIKLYKALGTTLRTAEVLNPQNGPATIQFIKNYNGLRKCYQYLFTGLNSEVLECNTKLDFAFRQVLPAQKGFLANIENVEQHAVYNDYQKKSLAIKQADDASEFAFAQQITAAKQPTNGSPILPGTPGAAGGTGSSSTVYAEDIISYTGDPFPVTVQESGTNVKEAAGTGFSGRFDRRRSIFATVLQQLTDSSSFSKLTMKIKGDPYWLGLNYATMLGLDPNTGAAATSTASGSNTNSTANNALQGGALLPDYSAGDHCFCLYFRFPYTVDENGAPVMKDDGVFSGLYRPSYITHSFENGIFTQTFDGANRVPSVTPQQSNALVNNKAPATPASTPSSA